MPQNFPDKPQPAPYKGPLKATVRRPAGGQESTRLFDNIAREALDGKRSVFDGLSDHEKAVVIQWYSDAIVDGNVNNAVYQTLWDIDFKTKPVDIDTFLTHEDYFGRTCKGLDEPLVHDLHEVFKQGSTVSEWILGGAIGTGKTTIAMAGLGYKLYHLSCMRTPSRYFGLVGESKIIFAVYSLTKFQAEDAGFYKLGNYIDGSPYFRDQFPREKNKERIRFKDSPLEVLFGSTQVHAIGLDLYGCALDESNFQRAKYDKSLQTVVSQAKELYTAVTTRMESRFMRPGGQVPGISILLSSRKTQTDFTDTRIAAANPDVKPSEAKGLISPRVYVSNYALWEVKPKRRFPGKKFWVEIGDRTHRSRVLGDGEVPRPGIRAIEVPGDFKRSFVEDVDQALRDIAGVATLSISPLVRDRESIYDAHRTNLAHPFTREWVEVALDVNGMGESIEDFFVLNVACQVRNSKYVPRLNPNVPRFIHCDMSLTGDAAGIVMSHPSGVVRRKVQNIDGTSSVDVRPFVIVDFMLQIRPPPGGETDLAKIRQFILYLRQFYTIPLVTFDGWQSVDAVQLLRKQKFDARVLSVDRTDEAYLALRSAYFERRIATYKYPIVETELLFLERDLKKKKVDHPAKFPDNSPGRKDVADALAASVWHCLTDARSYANMPLIEIDQALDDAGRPKSDTVSLPPGSEVINPPGAARKFGRIVDPAREDKPYEPVKAPSGAKLDWDRLRENLKVT